MRENVISICRLLDAKGLVSGTDGNISVRAGEDAMYVTASGTNKGRLTAEQILLQGFDGTVREGSMRSTREAKLHMSIYRQRADVHAIIHTHPPYATAFACRGQVLPMNVLTEVPVLLGRMAFSEYAPPGSDALVVTLDGLFEKNDIIFMANHGIIICGVTLEQAFDRMDALENAAKTIFIATTMGNIRKIPDEQLALL